MERVDLYNQDVKDWTGNTRQKLKLKVISLTKAYTGQARKNLTGSTKKYMGEANKIQFGFPLHMIFVHKGAGRGYGGGITGGFTKLTAKGYIRKDTKTSSLGKMGTGKRVAKPWFNPVIEQRFPELADIVATYKGEQVIINIARILVK